MGIKSRLRKGIEKDNTRDKLEAIVDVISVMAAYAAGACEEGRMRILSQNVGKAHPALRRIAGRSNSSNDSWAPG